MVIKVLQMTPILHGLFNTHFLNITESLGLSVPDNNDSLNLDEPTQ